MNLSRTFTITGAFGHTHKVAVSYTHPLYSLTYERHTVTSATLAGAYAQMCVWLHDNSYPSATRDFNYCYEDFLDSAEVRAFLATAKLSTSHIKGD